MDNYKLVDTIDLMYGIFQCCRTGYCHPPEALNQLDEILPVIKQQKTFVVKVSAAWVEKHKMSSSMVGWLHKITKDVALSPANQALFNLICVGAPELRRLWEAESIDAVRFLGYAFHNVPRLLRTPEGFHPLSFSANMRMRGQWPTYSLEMRQAICKMSGESPEA